MKPGEIYSADFPHVGLHPVIVLSRESLNRGGQAVVVLCTSARLAVRRTLPNCVPFQAGQFGFTKDCVAQCEQLLSIDRHEIPLHGPVGQLDELALRDVIKAIGYVMESDCEPV
ncbi:MAG: type II toxin-antitoxin system PemK/MazF family toxin [Planctomycetia bacterium]|nr:type II toxin-antitoxin system PemK/MazF family toxin [Planctomycetia bacterium]